MTPLPPKFRPMLALLRKPEVPSADADADDALYRYWTDQRREMIVRLLTVGLPALAIWLAYDTAVPILAYGVYCLTILALQGGTLDLRKDWSDVTYRRVMVLQAMAAAQFSGMTLWLLAQPQPELKLAAAALLIGSLLYGLTASVRGPQLQRIETLINTLTILAFGVLLLDPSSGLTENAMIAVFTVALATYFHVAAQEKLRERDRMQNATRAGLNAKGQAAVGRLAGGFAHDFNNMLTAILGNLDLYDSARTTAEERAAIAAARQAAERGAQSVEQLLSVSGRALMQPDRLDLPAYFNDLRQATHRLFGPEVSVQYQTHPGLPPVIVDRSQLTAALIQLLINARDAMPDGGLILLEASRARHPQSNHGPRLRPGPYVQIDLYDEGVGINPADLPRVTEPFFTTRKFGEATGLGLSVAKGFAEQSGGSLTIRSAPGKGTRVTLTLPAAESSAQTSAQTSVPAASPKDAQQPLPPRRSLP